MVQLRGSWRLDCTEARCFAAGFILGRRWLWKKILIDEINILNHSRSSRY
jgi:hypothetical protein